MTNYYFYRTAERLFQIIGETVFTLNMPGKSLSVPDKDKIMGLRHWIVNKYDRVDVAWP
jgi:uncharacterized protein with HEPN domain